MLRLIDGSSFTVGRSQFVDHANDQPEATAKIHVKVCFGALGIVTHAQIDTGAAWSMLNSEIAEELSLLNGGGLERTVRTSEGAVSGRLERVELILVADRGQGDSLTIEATFLVSAQWTRQTFLGYSGLLDHLRFAVDPQRGWFYFGP